MCMVSEWQDMVNSVFSSPHLLLSFHFCFLPRGRLIYTQTYGGLSHNGMWNQADLPWLFVSEAVLKGPWIKNYANCDILQVYVLYCHTLITQVSGSQNQTFNIMGNSLVLKFNGKCRKLKKAVSLSSAMTLSFYATLYSCSTSPEGNIVFLTPLPLLTNIMHLL